MFDPEVVAGQIQTAVDRAQFKTHLRSRYQELTIDDRETALPDYNQLG